MRAAIVLIVGAFSLYTTVCHAETPLPSHDGRDLTIGVQLQAGGRYDNVRMCVASPKGSKGGPAMDIGVFVEFPLSTNVGLGVYFPLFRPILFGAAFSMLQLEPTLTLLLRAIRGVKLDVVTGPSLGVILHYGPDFHSGKSGDSRRSDFFALGPRIGTYLGFDFQRPDKMVDVLLGLEPYVSPLIAEDTPGNHMGIVFGGLLTGTFRFI